MSTEASRPFGLRDYLAALDTQRRVIGALIMRELHTRYGRDNIGYLWMIGEPMILAGIVGLIHAAQGGHSQGDLQPLPFAVAGYTCFIAFRGIVNRSDGVIEINGALLYHRQVTILDIQISRAILEAAGVFLTFVALMLLLWGLDLAQLPARPLAVIAAWGLIIWYSFGHSLIISSLTYENHTVGRLVHQYSYFMVALSGAFSPMDWLPGPIREGLGYIRLRVSSNCCAMVCFTPAVSIIFTLPILSLVACF